MEVVVETHIPITPVAKERPRVNTKTRTVYTPGATRDYEDAIGQYMHYKTKQKNEVDDLAVWVTFHTDKGKADIDNYIKALFDGCNKVVWKDDKQVIETHAYLKRNAERTGIDFKVAVAQ